MNTIDLAQFALPVVIGYFSVSGKRLVDLKVFAVWCALTVLMCSHIHSIYLLATNNEMEFWVRYSALNISALGVLVLLATALFFKKYLRADLLSKMDQA
ncbi:MULTISPECIES: hypothetical protein [Pseudomonas]|uniref:hypothetical protein n=1 Tax=Pseudomonas TaxID=286 RepID=UPI0005A77EDC|nr:MULTISPECIES: hypothetical protein [Pseudomonas]AZD93122.1 hypothetical protein C4K13_3706 [Pseudomonas chlororaphis subsp. aureofaciens]AZE36636.1 hypothetical protein C4K06_3604 [Pseudomonas chlororaphis subsp. aureofaciens]KAB0532718.1 hypothetical protein F7R16_10745 [Pseudomonas chlororaphis subsp. aureofaciens]TSD26094.1 hypothetical protein FCE86_032045 [Pseudomonas sp. ATCC 13985]WDG57923.1 hypothetical protein PUP52_18945 [Pseudomonas chlororaphis]